VRSRVPASASDRLLWHISSVCVSSTHVGTARGGKDRAPLESNGLVWPRSGRAVNLGVFLQLNLPRTAAKSKHPAGSSRLPKPRGISKKCQKTSKTGAAWLLARARGARSAVDHHMIFKIVLEYGDFSRLFMVKNGSETPRHGEPWELGDG
jgi:hypothetical protein